MERARSSRLSILNVGKIMGALTGVDALVSDFKLCARMLLRVRSCLSLSEMSVATGRREGRQANEDEKAFMLANSMFVVFLPT